MRRYSLLVLALVVAAVCVRLGFWQVRRLGERRALNATIRGRLAQAPVDLDQPLPDSLYFRRAIARGVYDFDHETIIVNRSLDGLPGVYVVTPLRLESGRTILVERGWLYAPDGRSVNLGGTREPGAATVSGVILDAPTTRPLAVPPAQRASGDTWPKAAQRLDPLLTSFAYPPITAVVRRAPLIGTFGPGGLRAIDLPVLDDGPHLSYAVQWFAFAIIAVVGGLAWAKGGDRASGERGTGKREMEGPPRPAS